MGQGKSITFVVAVNKRDVLEANFEASPCLQGQHQHQIILQEGFRSAPIAYNDAIYKSVNDLIVFCHQDMYFPEHWIEQLQATVQRLEEQGAPWGVLGCSGVTRDRRYLGLVYSVGIGIIGTSSEPAEVQTLDEIVLVIRKSSGLRFDQNLPHFHLYGADICLRASAKSLKSYAISALCVHNTLQGSILPDEFYECCSYMKRTWKKELPIQTTCIRITKFNLPIYRRRLREAYERLSHRTPALPARVSDVRLILKGFEGRI